MVTDLFWNIAHRALDISTAFADTTGGGNTTNNPTTIKLFDPLKGESLASLAQKIIDGLLIIAIPVVTIMVVIGSYYIITSGGNPGRRTTGKDYILWAAIGFGILLLADSVALIVENFVK